MSEFEHKPRGGRDVAHAASHQRSEPMPTRGQQVEDTLRDLASWIDRVRTAFEAVDQPSAATDREESHARLVRLIRRADDSLARARARVQALAAPDATDRIEEAAATLAKYKADAPPVTVADAPDGSAADALHVFSPERSAFARLTSRRPAPPPRGGAGTERSGAPAASRTEPARSGAAVTSRTAQADALASPVEAPAAGQQSNEIAGDRATTHEPGVSPGAVTTPAARSAAEPTSAQTPSRAEPHATTVREVEALGPRFAALAGARYLGGGVFRIAELGGIAIEVQRSHGAAPTLRRVADRVVMDIPRGLAGSAFERAIVEQLVALRQRGPDGIRPDGIAASGAVITDEPRISAPSTMNTAAGGGASRAVQRTPNPKHRQSATRHELAKSVAEIDKHGDAGVEQTVAGSTDVLATSDDADQLAGAQQAHDAGEWVRHQRAVAGGQSSAAPLKRAGKRPDAVAMRERIEADIAARGFDAATAITPVNLIKYAPDVKLALEQMLRLRQQSRPFRAEFRSVAKDTAYRMLDHSLLRINDLVQSYGLAGGGRVKIAAEAMAKDPDLLETEVETWMTLSKNRDINAGALQAKRGARDDLAQIAARLRDEVRAVKELERIQAELIKQSEAAATAPRRSPSVLDVTSNDDEMITIDDGPRVGGFGRLGPGASKPSKPAPAQPPARYPSHPMHPHARSPASERSRAR